MDVKRSFLQGDLAEEIYMEPPPDFVTNSALFFHLKKSLYGLKQVPQAWYEKIDQFFVNLGFKRCNFDQSIYVLRIEGNTLIFVIYVDDLSLETILISPLE